MPQDGAFDYRTLTREQLEEALANVDPSRYPENHRRLVEELTARRQGLRAEPPHDPEKARGTREFLFALQTVVAFALALYGVVCLARGELSIYGRRGALVLHGTPVWLGAAAAFVAAFAIAGGVLDEAAEKPSIRRGFAGWLVFAWLLWSAALLWPQR